MAVKCRRETKQTLRKQVPLCQKNRPLLLMYDAQGGGKALFSQRKKTEVGFGKVLLDIRILKAALGRCCSLYPPLCLKGEPAAFSPSLDQDIRKHSSKNETEYIYLKVLFHI